MAVSPLADHYTRYKLGTAKVIKWLGEEAQRVAERSGNLLNLPNPITTKTLVRLAKMVSLAEPRVAVPLSVLLVLEDVIRGRQRCADFYGELEVNTSNGKFTPTNSSHRHFITVLEEVRAFLKALEIEKPNISDHSAVSHSKPAGKLTRPAKKNIFETLELEEPSEHLQLPPDKLNKVEKKTEQPRGYPEMEEDEDAKHALAIWCMFEDIREVRNHIRLVWRDFYDGKISFLAAVELTQIAFVFIQQIAWNLGESKDGSAVSYDQIANSLGIVTTVDHNGRVIIFLSKTNIVPTGKTAELLCITGWTILQDFRACIVAPHVPQYQHLRFSRHSFADTLRQCEPILRHMATVLGDDSERGSVEGFWVDAFTWNLLEIYRNRCRITIETVAWCQILLDVLAAFGGEASRGNEILQDMLQRGSYETRLNEHEQKFPESHDSEFSRWAREVFASSDPNGLCSSMDIIRFRLLDGKHPWPSDRNPQDLLKHLPLLAGFRLSHIKISHCIQSFREPADSDFALEHAALLSMAYLYRAARSVGLVRNEWPDMETVIASQTLDGLYVRDAESLLGYARHFDLAIGVPATSFARNATRRPALPGRTTIWAKMKKLQPASNFARRRAHDQDLQAAGMNSWNAFYAALYKDAQSVRKAPTTHLTSIELLQTIQRGMEADEVYLKFDYLAFSMQCRALFALLYLDENARLQKLTGKETPDVVESTHAILWEAADTPPNSILLERPLLAAAADTIEMISTPGGSSYLSTAQHGTSGHIKPNERPSSRHQWGGESQSSS